MNKHTIQFLFLALLLSACAPLSSSSLDPVQPITTPPSTPSFLLPVQRVIIHSASYSITVEDPTRAMSDLQRAVEKAGGYVVSAPSWSGEDSSAYASLSAKVPPESLPALREAVNKIADQVQNQSFYVQDITSDFRKLQGRHQELIQAQDQTFRFLTQTKGHGMDSTYKILRELLDNELNNVENQLDSYEQQSKLATFDITLNQPANLNVTIE